MRQVLAELSQSPARIRQSGKSAFLFPGDLLLRHTVPFETMKRRLGVPSASMMPPRRAAAPAEMSIG